MYPSYRPTAVLPPYCPSYRPTARTPAGNLPVHLPETCRKVRNVQESQKRAGKSETLRDRNRSETGTAQRQAQAGASRSQQEPGRVDGRL